MKRKAEGMGGSISWRWCPSFGIEGRRLTGDWKVTRTREYGSRQQNDRSELAGDATFYE